MSQRIKDKTKDIENYLSELEEIFPDSFEIYENDNVIRAACERYFEKIVEAMTDLGYLILKENNFELPEDDLGVFEILLENKIIDSGIASRMRQAKQMKNFISHQYGFVDDERVYETISEELFKDCELFLKQVEKFLMFFLVR